MVPVSLVRSSVGPDSGPDANLVLSVIRIFVRTKTGQIPEPDQIKAIFGPVQISKVMKNPEWSGLSARTGPVPKYLRNQWPDQNLDENFGSDRTWTNEILEFVDRSEPGPRIFALHYNWKWNIYIHFWSAVMGPIMRLGVIFELWRKL